MYIHTYFIKTLVRQVCGADNTYIGAIDFNLQVRCYITDFGLEGMKRCYKNISREIELMNE